MIRIDSHACRPVAWLNGGGLTRELARGPVASAQAEFGWRLSLADIERDGPFSRMAGCDRSFALVEGAISLELPDGRVLLDARSDPVPFAGELAPMAELRGDSICRAFNLIVARGRWTGRMRRIRLTDGQRLDAEWVDLNDLTDLAKPGEPGEPSGALQQAMSAADAAGLGQQPVQACFLCRGRLIVEGSQVEAGEYLQFGPADAMPTAIGTASLIQILIRPVSPRPDVAPPSAR
jgi:environmental stress-induced protein Ves